MEDPPGLGKVEEDLVGCLEVSIEGCYHRTSLLVAGRQQERRCSTVALHANGVEVLFRMGKLSVAMRFNASARMDVWIDQRA